MAEKLNKTNQFNRIKSIELQNFKGIKDKIEIELSPITLLFGANSAGKSTIMHALLYAKEIFERQNFDPVQTQFGGNYVDLGGFQNLVYNHDLNNEMIIAFNISNCYFGGMDSRYRIMIENVWEYRQSKLLDNFFNIDNIKYSIRLKYNKEYSQILTEIDISLDFEFFFTLGTEMNDPFKKQYFIKNINFAHSKITKVLEELNLQSSIVSCLNKVKEYFHNDPQWMLPVILRDAIENGSYKPVDYSNLDNFNKIKIRLEDFNFQFSDFSEHNGLRFSINDTNENRWLLKFLNFYIPPVHLLYNEYFNTENYNNTSHVLGELYDIINFLIIGNGNTIYYFLKNFRYIGPLREIPSRNFRPNKFLTEDRWWNGLAAWDLLYRSHSGFDNDPLINLIEDVSYWLSSSKKLNTNYEIVKRNYTENYEDNNEVIRKSRIVLRDKFSKIELSPNDVGVGFSQILPIIVASIYKDNSSILAIEQPELHIHPKLQTELGDLLIENKDNKIFLIETHSEHLMLRLLRRVEEHELDNEEISVYYFESTQNGTKVTKLPIDETGEFTEQWPQGFFEERAEELFR
ncbi:MAG: DUF3696 domain-containing protein [Candidatus Kapabacteria bacterium]|nr:DUF3696 domain-containing protein [Candidatus Kapabacteria bacterium]